MTAFEPAIAPTLYFFGVTTTKSSIMKMFPAWAKRLGLDGAVINGVDFPLHAPPESHRAAVAFLKSHPKSLGALVTTHKIEMFAIGAGGSTIAMTWHLMQKTRGADRPSPVIVSDRDPARLNEIRRVHGELSSDVPVRYLLAADKRDNDAALASLRPGSLIVNATGLSKDAPGSPLTDAAQFPGRASWRPP